MKSTPFKPTHALRIDQPRRIKGYAACRIMRSKSDSVESVRERAEKGDPAAQDELAM
jgi:hypothetical protein